MKRVLVLTAFFVSTFSLITAQRQPNILFILSDDAGYADFGFQGSKEMKTPNLDKLASEGMKFDQAYVSAAVCGPSRAGILTGRYQQRFGYEENNVPGIMSKSCLPDDEMGLPLDEITVADYLKKLGYHTALVGKWHQGNSDQFHPLKRGFDEFYGFRGGARSYFEFTDQNPNYRKEDWLERGFGDFLESKQYLTDAFADEVISIMKRNQDSPWFIMLSFNAVHAPMNALEDDLAQFPDMAGNRQKLAAMTLAMDRACGRILDHLSAAGLEKNTIVVFTNDNGGPTDANASNNHPLSGTKASHIEGGIRVPFILNWPGTTTPGSTYQYPVSTLDLLPTFYSAGGGQISDLTNIDGVDLKEFISNRNPERPHQTLYWKKESRGAIRDGDYKLIRYPDRPAELYFIPNDPDETHNLAYENPELVKSLYKKLFSWEMTLDRSLWQLQRKYEGLDLERMDAYSKPKD